MNQEEHIGLWINIASHQIRRNIDLLSAHYGISGIQSRILGHLARAEKDGKEIFHRDLEKCFGIRRSSVTSVVSHLENNGYVTRMSVPGDARLKKLVLTQKGLDVTVQMDRAISEFEASISACFTPQEQEQFLRMLKTVSQMLDDCSRQSCCKTKSEQEDDTLC